MISTPDIQPFKQNLLRNMATFSLLGSAGLTLSGCGGNTPTSLSQNPTPEKTTVSYIVHQEYLPDGKRVTRIDSSDQDIIEQYAQHAPIVAYCDGTDLVEATFFNNDYDINTSDRTPNFKGCDDGKLTPSDFERSK